MWGGRACDEGLVGLLGRMNQGGRLGALGRLECQSPNMVIRWEVRTWKKGVGGVGRGAGRRGSL